MAAFALNNLIGLARQMVVLNAFGTSGEMDAFLAANRVSETLFTLVAGVHWPQLLSPHLQVH